jgi:uncharacterized membrane protein
MWKRAVFPVSVLCALVLRLSLYKLMAIPFGGLATAMCQYDCGWYVRIATDGYGSDALFADYAAIPNWAFFPLFPLLLRAAYAISGQAPYFVGLLVSNALFAGFILLGAAYLKQTRAITDPLLWVVFMALFPFSYTFSAIYSEGLFAVLSVAALMLLQQRRVLAASGVTALLCATRPTGVLMLPLIIADRARHLWLGRDRPDRVALLGETLLPIAIAPLGLSIYMLVQYLRIGDALAFNHVQVLWDRVWIGPLATVANGLGAWDWSKVLAPKGLPSQSYAAAWAVLGLIVAGWVAWRRRFAESFLLAASILLPLATALHSMPRFVTTNPFFLFAVFDAVLLLRQRLALAAIFGTAGLLHGAVLVFWFISASSTY